MYVSVPVQQDPYLKSKIKFWRLPWQHNAIEKREFVKYCSSTQLPVICTVCLIIVSELLEIKGSRVIMCYASIAFLINIKLFRNILHNGCVVEEIVKTYITVV